MAFVPDEGYGRLQKDGRCIQHQSPGVFPFPVQAQIQTHRPLEAARCLARRAPPENKLLSEG